MKRGVLCKYCTPYKDSNKIFCHLKNCDVEGYKCDKGHCSYHSFEPAAMVVVGVGRCDECPCVKQTRTPRAGYALDYHCKAIGGKQIDHYVEYDFELRPVHELCPFYIKGGNYETTQKR